MTGGRAVKAQMATSGAKNCYVRASGQGFSPEEVQGEVEQGGKDAESFREVEGV